MDLSFVAPSCLHAAYAESILPAIERLQTQGIYRLEIGKYDIGRAKTLQDILAQF